MKIKIFIVIILFIIPAISLAQFDLDLESFFFNEFNSTSNISIKSIDLIWSVDTYTPYNYEGRALPSPGSKVVIEAIISTSGGNANNLKYSWFLEDIFQKNKSGYGKDRFYFYVLKNPGSYYTIKLQIFNESRTIFEEKSIEILIVRPELVIKSLNLSFAAKPYFFSIDKLTDLEFEWHISGQESIISSDYNASVLDISIANRENLGTIETNLWVSVINKKDSRQTASQTIKITIY